MPKEFFKAIKQSVKAQTKIAPGHVKKRHHARSARAYAPGQQPR